MHTIPSTYRRSGRCIEIFIALIKLQANRLRSDIGALISRSSNEPHNTWFPLRLAIKCVSYLCLGTTSKTSTKRSFSRETHILSLSPKLTHSRAALRKGNLSSIVYLNLCRLPWGEGGGWQKENPFDCRKCQVNKVRRNALHDIQGLSLGVMRHRRRLS